MNNTIKHLLILLYFIIMFFSADYVMADNRIKIAIIDTGMNNTQKYSNYLCDNTTYPVVNNDITDQSGHGSNIAGIIMEHMDINKHCLLIYKVTDSNSSGAMVALAINTALSHAIYKGAKYINISMGGPTANITEENLIKKALNKGIIVSVAAGNEGDNLDVFCNFYPACYRKNNKHKNFHVIGNTTSDSSNYGSIVNYKYDGTIKDKFFNIELTGTSQATAKHTGLLLLKK